MADGDKGGAEAAAAAAPAAVEEANAAPRSLAVDAPAEVDAPAPAAAADAADAAAVAAPPSLPDWLGPSSRTYLTPEALASLRAGGETVSGKKKRVQSASRKKKNKPKLSRPPSLMTLSHLPFPQLPLQTPHSPRRSKPLPTPRRGQHSPTSSSGQSPGRSSPPRNLPRRRSGGRSSAALLLLLRPLPLLLPRPRPLPLLPPPLSSRPSTR